MLQLVALIGADCITDRLTGLMWSKNGIIGSAATAGGAPLTRLILMQKRIIALSLVLQA
ncbi:MAG: hypothetical protein K2X04_09095 [Burkholderiales bacterium]|nr:hypothetical protein [Burkholderiales bacterium]